VIASAKTPSLKSSVGLAAWGPVNEAQVKVPTLLFCGTADAVAPCSDHSDPAYATIPNTTPKMKIVIDGAEHLASWFGPADGGGGVSGGWALAFEKVYLEGDTRWKTLLLGKPAGSTQTTNITP
jgi:pimeloyl-ACP methyl ester carboxylesterase